MNTSSNKARLPRNVSLDNGHTAEYRVNIHGVKDNQPKNTLQEITDMLLETDLMIDNTTSEPRDILMTERTALSWVKFSITLATIAITIVTNFRLDTSGNNSGGGNDENSPPWLPKFSYGTAILFVLLSMATLSIGCLSYFQSIYNYKEHSVNTYSLKTTLGFLFIVGLVLLSVNIVFVAAVN
ncbi:hypothetical protein C6P40_001582 [Pichia californica]|uniref:DUF202 domain-containing protein n=1 Tax=Pichia californica TaxID=460514 RepID=A0A9P6WLK9_9ASCO|nr:hypothetical protein C6P40_001582 [[Candida] californica]